MPLLRSFVAATPRKSDTEDHGPRLSSGAPRGHRPSTSAGFRAPRPSSGASEAGGEEPRRLSSTREVIYPPTGTALDTINANQIEQRISRLSSLDYHQPVKRQRSPAGEGESVTVTAVESHAAAGDQQAAVTAAVSEPTERSDPEVVIARLPESARGNLYYQIHVEEATTKHDAVGLIIVNVAASAVQMFDRQGRQYGSRPDPGYPIKEAEIASLAPGTTVKVGLKVVRIITALYEDAFRSGEFFLRSEHEQRVREERKASREAAVAVAMRKAKMSLGSGHGFAPLQFRKRPVEGQTGFIVPRAGRLRVHGERRGVTITEEIRPLHDPDRDSALVLFRADYKRDINGQRVTSVVVDPIVSDRLRPHQRAGVQFLFDCVTGARMPGYYGAILADEMGLGKTVQTVATVWTCLKQGKFGMPITSKAIIVAPSSLVRNWCNEFEKWLGPNQVHTLAIAETTTKGDRILSRFESEGDVLVISYDQLRKYIERLASVRSVDLVVCDEGHRLKNAEIKTSRAVDRLPTKRRIVLSGTPIQNDLAEFHAMVSFVNPGILGNTDLFKRVYEEPVMRGRDPNCTEDEKELGRDRAHYLANITKKFILRRTQSINEKYLPPKVDLTVFIRLGKEQHACYKRIAESISEFHTAPLALITALKKLCNHMDLLYDAVHGEGSQLVAVARDVIPKTYKPGSLDFTFGAKLNFVSLMLDELLRNGDRDKLVIVSNYTQTLTIIAALCSSKRVPYFQLDGATPIKRRQELVDRFNVPTQREIVFLLSSKAGGVGLNLIGANRLILFDPDWNPANDAQAMGRVWRDGQQKRVFIYRLLSTGTIEEKVYQRQVSKQGLSANVVDMQEDSRQHFTASELKTLFTYRPDTVCDTHDLLHCRCLQQPKHVDAKPMMAFKRVDSSVAKKTSGPRMDELKGWDHVANASTFSLDKVIRAIAQHNPALISFIFANERDAEKLQGPQIHAERAFVADEGEITCMSQTGRGGEEEGVDNIELVDDEDSSSGSE